jgi:transcriptional regulator with GAF, ATPase, and Fis domain
LREVELLKKTESRINNHLSSESGFNLYKETQRFEAAMIRSALIQARGVQRKAAELLGLKVTTLNVKIKRYNINFGPTDLTEA